MPVMEEALRSLLFGFLSSRGLAGPLSRIVALACVACAVPVGASAAPIGLRAEYTLSIAGVPLAEFRMLGNFDTGSYVIGGTGDSMLVTSIIAPFRGSTKSEGRINGGRIRPDTYELDLKISDKRQTVNINFDRVGRVKDLAVDPQVSEEPTRIPLKDEHQRDVVDPISAVIMPLPDGALTGENVCGRTLPIFDGSYRYDMKLTYKRLERVPVAGAPSQRTEVYVCKIKYHPIAGHRPHRKSTVYWATNEDMEIWLTPLRSAGVLIPYRLVMPTPFGRAVAHISKIQLFADEQRAAAQ